MKRVLTAVILAPLIIWLVLWGPDAAFLAVLAAIAVVCFYEYSDIVAAYGIDKPGLPGYAGGLILLFAAHDPTLLLVLIALLSLGLALAAADLKTGLPRAAALVFGVLYTFGVWRYAALLRTRGTAGPFWLMFALAVTWFGDTGAYYIGKTLGRHKMAPRVSPGKTWEGAIGSIAASMIFGIVYLTRLIPGVSLPQSIAISAVANVAGQIGDLAESALKRGAGVKDSGTMLPGHGGWLDRVDSALFTVPVVYLLVTYFA